MSYSQHMFHKLISFFCNRCVSQICYFCVHFPALFLGSCTCSVMQYKQQRSFVFYFCVLHFFFSIIRILLRESFFLSFIQKVYFFTTLSVTKWAKTHRNHHHHNHTEYSEETTATTPVLLFQLLFYHRFENFKLLFQNDRACVSLGEKQLPESAILSQAVLALLIFSIKENLSNPQDSLIKYKAKAFFLLQAGVVGSVVVSTMFQRSCSIKNVFIRLLQATKLSFTFSGTETPATI